MNKKNNEMLIMVAIKFFNQMTLLQTNVCYQNKEKLLLNVACQNG